eukprot:CAMPEP_0173460926 /NCGR_PEP_ID=MMETSP1357-20121228/64023_1 /TAXON_ID=77926 /ORGANISM="Hemiselmis rufescens, Strain PCC563" /LENGTH=80 /DNA_ID=CAMNT_0014428531 /DNA_START=30 /DNA_END=270 /DNA_ORIENTATION=+
MIEAGGKGGDGKAPGEQELERDGADEKVLHLQDKSIFWRARLGKGYVLRQAQAAWFCRRRERAVQDVWVLQTPHVRIDPG